MHDTNWYSFHPRVNSNSIQNKGLSLKTIVFFIQSMSSKIDTTWNKILDIIHKLKETKINLRNSRILVSSLRIQDGLKRVSAKNSLTNQIHPNSTKYTKIEQLIKMWRKIK